MFKFNTTTVVNSATDFTSPSIPAFKGDNTSGKESFFATRGLTFKKPYVKAIYKRDPNDEEKAKVAIDLSGVTTAGVYRIAMYIRLEGSENEYYANDYVFKGKPLYIEFVKKASDTKLATKVKKIADKYMNLVYEQPVLTLTTDVASTNDKLIIEAVNGYQRFTQVELQQYGNTSDIINGCCQSIGEFSTIAALKIDADHAYIAGTGSSDKIKWEESNSLPLKGKCPFGTYSQIIKDLRLPTADNRRWGGIIADEVPVVGKKYTQFTIWYCRKVGVQGLDAVGDVTQSLTSHIFFVNEDVLSDWNTALGKLGVDITTVTDGQHTQTPEEIEVAAEAAGNTQTTTNATNITTLADAIQELATDTSTTLSTDISGLVTPNNP